MKFLVVVLTPPVPSSVKRAKPKRFEAAVSFPAVSN